MTSVIVVDGGAFADEVCAAVTKSDPAVASEVVAIECDGGLLTARQLAKELAARVKAAGPAALVFINADLACNDFGRAQQGGVEVFKHLRLTYEQTAHCLLYSFCELSDLIRRNPASACICAKGTTFCRLPFLLESLSITELVNRPADLNDFVPYVRGSAVLPDEKHLWANWYSAWEMLRIVECARGLDLGAERFRDSFSSSKRDALFGYRSLKVPAQVDEATQEMRSQQVAALGQVNIGLIDDCARHFGDFKEFGWARVMSQMLTGTDNRVRDVLADHRIETAGQVDGILLPLETIEALGWYDCLLIDLRLLQKDQLVVAPEDMSGAQVIRQVREFWPVLPIIVTTAASKLTTYEALRELAADGYWLKAGPADGRTSHTQNDDVDRLIELVTQAVRIEYRVAKRIGRELMAEGESTGRWWETPSWLVEDATARNGAIRRMVRELLQLMRLYLSQFIMGFGTEVRRARESDLGKQVALGSIVLHVGKIVEAIHCMNTINQDRGLDVFLAPRDSKKIRQFDDPLARKDSIAAFLSEFRNRAAHYGDDRGLTWVDAVQAMALLVCYMRHGSQAGVSAETFRRSVPAFLGGSSNFAKEFRTLAGER